MQLAKLPKETNKPSESSLQQLAADSPIFNSTMMRVTSDANESSQRARSIVFLSYGVLLATALNPYLDGREVTLYVCENGFISLNPPMTGSRLGSLSTRTTHPLFLRLFQQLLSSADIRVQLKNPYQYMTKGEMIRACTNQALLKEICTH